MSDTDTSPKLYLLNAAVITDYGDWRFEGPLALERARQIAKAGFISAIGHESTAQVLGTLLQMPVHANRLSISMAPGDRALVFRLNRRLPEARVLTEEELQDIGYELGLLTRLK